MNSGQQTEYYPILYPPPFLISQGNHHSDFKCYPLGFAVFELHINETTQKLLFLHPASFTILCSEIHPHDSCSCRAFVLTVQCWYDNSFIHPTVDGHLEFYHCAIIVAGCEYSSLCLDKLRYTYPLGICLGHISSFSKSQNSVSKIASPHFASSPSVYGFWRYHNLLNTYWVCVFFIFGLFIFKFSHSDDTKWYIIVLFVSISLEFSEIKLVFWISSFGKLLFKFLFVILL